MTHAPLIESVPGRCGGRPTIAGTRLEPRHLAPYAKAGDVEGVLADHPQLTRAQVDAAFAHLDAERAAAKSGFRTQL